MTHRLSRRDVLKVVGGITAATLLPGELVGCGSGFPVNSSQGSAGQVLPSKARLPRPFRTTLTVPPVLAPARTDDQADYYEVIQRAAQVQILPGRQTPIWGYNGIFPGPTIQARSGRLTVVNHRNELPVPTVVHLHGGRTPSRDDGYPTDYLLPVSGFPHSALDDAGRVHNVEYAYQYPLQQRAATLWYHDHRMDFTGPSVWRGLAGFFLVHDAVEDALPLPTGERDVPLMIVDRSFAADGSLQYPSVDPSLIHTPGVTKDYMSGVLGDCILVNGRPWPVMKVTATRYRFRILNASNARRYRLTIDPKPADASFVQVGTGQGLLNHPVPLDAIDIAQAERFDVIVDFSHFGIGTKITLGNDNGDGATAKVMQFHVSGAAADNSQIPDQLGGNIQPLSKADAVRTRTFIFALGGAKRNGVEVWTINGRPFDPNHIDARVRHGTTEHWTIQADNLPHPFHIHEDPFQVIGLNSAGQPGTYDKGWKDVINLDSGGRGDLLIRFDGYPGKYVFHCHNLEHEDMMMMANFEIV